MNNQLQLVTFKQAKQLKELGFDWQCTAYYHKGILKNYSFEGINNSSRKQDCNNEHNISKETAAAPTVSLALKWIRDVKMKPCSIETYFYTHKVNGIITVDTTYRGRYLYYIEAVTTDNFNTYEEAEKDLLDILLLIIKYEWNK